MLELLEWLEGSGFGRIARESLYGFQILVAIHILGLIVSLGTLLWVDLRMLGLALAQQPLPAVYRSLSRCPCNPIRSDDGCHIRRDAMPGRYRD